LVSQLASAFPATGLWPLCWGWRQDEVDDLFRDPPVLAETIDALDAADVTARWWEEVHPDLTGPFGTAFPGLAAPSDAQVSGGNSFAPVDDELGWQYGREPGRQILLVPCHRPADALGVIAWQGQRLGAAEICAMLRSWEERFAAFPIAADGSSITLAVGAPPTTAEQALRLAAEMTAVASPEEDVAGTAEALVGPPQSTLSNDLTPTCWRLDFDHE
jgi:hypothetical protein